MTKRKNIFLSIIIGISIIHLAGCGGDFASEPMETDIIFDAESTVNDMAEEGGAMGDPYAPLRAWSFIREKSIILLRLWKRRVL